MTSGEQDERSEKRKGEVTRLLERIRQGDRDAENALYPVVYAELHRIATRLFRRERKDNTLQPTALVNEAYIRLVEQHTLQNRGHFLAVAARLMRRILLDHARRQLAEMRGARHGHISLDEGIYVATAGPQYVIDLEFALADLEKQSPRAAKVVELKFYGGLTVDEIAEHLGSSSRTVDRDLEQAMRRLRLALAQVVKA
jgi:RNA polymerase sigma factor (TIGR02999 family)